MHGLSRASLTYLQDVLTFSGVPVAIFDESAELVVASEAFLRLFHPVEAFLKTGTSWALFLSEAVRHGVIEAEAAHRLSMMEETLEEAQAALRELITECGGNKHRFVLTEMPDNGFALKVELADTGSHGDERELEELMAKVLEACPTCLSMARIGDGRIIYRSPEATTLLGKGFDSKAHFVKREERADFLTTLLPNARVDDMRFTARRADGSSFPASISARLIDYRGEDVIVSSIYDLSDELAMQSELTRRKDQIHQAEKLSSLGEVLAGVAHELNNPLSIVVGNAHMLVEDGIEGPALRRVEKLSAAADRCASIVRAFLAMARNRPMALERVAVYDLLVFARESFNAGQSGNISIELDIAENTPNIEVDRVQILQVLANLLNNGAQAMREKSGKIRIEAGQTSGAYTVWIRVSDEGPGVPPEIAGRIFDPLFTTKEAGKGTGIGLALSHRIVVAHRGTLSLDQRLGAGASFVIELPSADAEFSETNETRGVFS